MSRTIVLVDDVRSFRDGRRCTLARSDVAAIGVLRSLEGSTIDEVWLDYDLGIDPTSGRRMTTLPVARELIDGCRDDRFRVVDVMIHSANPGGAVLLRKVLEQGPFRVIRWYDLRTWVHRRTEVQANPRRDPMSDLPRTP